MAAETGISWCDSTFNPWIGCTKVSPGCDHCYAEALDKRMRYAGATHWGSGAPRMRTSASNWANPVKWQKQHLAFSTEHRRRRRVFCASLADVFDNEVPQAWRDDLWALIRSTPDLDWLILTKRIGNVKDMLPEDWGRGYQNVWLVITIVNQVEADRDIPKLLTVPAMVHGLSMEPLLGSVDLTSIEWPNKGGHRVDVLRGGYWNAEGYMAFGPSAALGAPRGGFTNHSDMERVSWVIVGGESGPGARPMNEEWVRSLREQCERADTAFFYKQRGGADRDKGGCLLNGVEVKEWPRAA